MDYSKELERVKDRYNDIDKKRNYELGKKDLYEEKISEFQKEYNSIIEEIKNMKKEKRYEQIPLIVSSILSLAISYGIGRNLDLSHPTIQKILTFLVLSGITISTPAFGIYLYSDDKRMYNFWQEKLTEKRRIASHNLLANRLFLENSLSKIEIYDRELNKLLDIIIDLEMTLGINNEREFQESVTPEVSKVYKKVK